MGGTASEAAQEVDRVLDMMHADSKLRNFDESGRLNKSGISALKSSFGSSASSPRPWVRSDDSPQDMDLDAEKPTSPLLKRLDDCPPLASVDSDLSVTSSS